MLLPTERMKDCKAQTVNGADHPPVLSRRSQTPRSSVTSLLPNYKLKVVEPINITTQDHRENSTLR